MDNTWIELDLAVLRDNIGRITDALSPESRIILVVKSDAYGHGMVPVARCVRESGVNWFAVTQTDEAVRLREAVDDARILIMGRISGDEVSTAIAHDVLPVIVDEDHGSELASAAGSSSEPLRCHVKIDTGMGRLGIPWETAAEAVARLAGNTSLRIEGICSHFASSSHPDPDYSDEQARRFTEVVAGCEERGIEIPFKHVANSGALLHRSELDYDGVRSGILPYGYRPERRYGKAEAQERKRARAIETQPFLQWKTRVIQVKELPAGAPVGYDSTYRTADRTRIAVLDAGYADGYRRQLSNNGWVLLEGRRVPIAGIVSMNFVAVDLGLETNVGVGDEAVLIGSQGDASVWADEIAEQCGTISYDILTGIRTSKRVAI